MNGWTDSRELTIQGLTRTSIEYDEGKKVWTLALIDSNVTGTLKASHASYTLGRQRWAIQGDTDCSTGDSYDIDLKMSGCPEGKFTCDDGQCVKMVERCNQVPDCRDKSDENECQLVVFENNYNMNVPPIGRAVDGSAVPAKVGISINLMKVVEIQEVDHAIALQFQINMRWTENRVKYQNLKSRTSLNALTKNDIGKLWLPLIVYDNTDQKQTTRLGMEWEWATRVSVVKEGDFTRSGYGEVNEAEIFEGDENTLTMTQTYTWEFQCEYKLQKYPFDTQV